MHAARPVPPFVLRASLAAFFALVVAAPVFAASGYSLHTLPEAPGDVSSDAYSVHVEGGGSSLAMWIAGRSTSPGGVHHAVVWDSGADLGSASVTPLGTIAPGASSEVRSVRCADGSCRAAGTEGEPGTGRAPRVWSSSGGSWGPPVSLTCPAQTPPATADVGIARGVIITISGSSFGNTACGACDVTEGATGAVQQATVWEESPPGTWTPVSLPGLSVQPGRSSEATAIFLLPVPGAERLVAVGWAEDDAFTRQPVLWERSGGAWSATPLPLPAGSRGGEVHAGDYGIAGQAFVLDGTRSTDDGRVLAYHWRQLSGPPGQLATWEGQDLAPLPGFDGSSARAVAGRRGASQRQSLRAAFNVIGTSTSNGGLPPTMTLWEVYPLSTETYQFDLSVRDLPGNATAANIEQSVRAVPVGDDGGARISVGSLTTAGPPAAGAEGVVEETHAVALVQLEPAPNLNPTGMIVTLILLIMAAAAVLVLSRRKVVA